MPLRCFATIQSIQSAKIQKAAINGQTKTGICIVVTSQRGYIYDLADKGDIRVQVVGQLLADCSSAIGNSVSDEANFATRGVRGHSKLRVSVVNLFHSNIS